MAIILASSAKFQPEELLKLLASRPHLLHPRIRFLQGPFPIQNLGSLDLLGLDDQGGWVLVKIAQEGAGKVLLDALHQITWVQDHSEWIATLPAYALADPLSMSTVFLVAPHFDNSLSEVLGYLRDVTVGLVKYSAFEMGDQKAIHFEPLFQAAEASTEGDFQEHAKEGPAETRDIHASGSQPGADHAAARRTDVPLREPNLSLLQPLTDAEIAEFLPGGNKDKMA